MALFCCVYMCLFVLCAYHSFPLLNNGGKTYSNMGDEKFFLLLSDIAEDTYSCQDCIQYHIGTEALKSFLEKQSLFIEEKKRVKVIRTILNILSISNSLITFMVLGGSEIITFISCCSTFSIVASIFVENVIHVVLLEVSVCVVSSVLLFKCCYLIVRAIIVIEKAEEKDR